MTLARSLALLLAAAGSTAATVATPAIPDKWAPFQPRRITSSNGTHYAILQAERGYSAGPYSLHERREGEEPLPTKTKGKPDAADQIVAKGKLPRLPLDAFVTEKPLGIVLFDTYARLGSGSILSLLDEAGKTAWSVDLDDLFGGPPKGSRRTVSSLRWNTAWGVDEERGSAWVLTNGSEFREVSLRNGKITTPDAGAIASWCRTGAPKDRVRVLDALLETHPKLGHVHGPRFAELADDKAQPLGLRLRAALAANRAGVHADSWLELFGAAIDDDDASARTFAAMRLRELDEDRGRAALHTLLADHAARKSAPQGRIRVVGRAEYALVQAFRRLGERGAKLLDEVENDESAPDAARAGATALRTELDRTRVPASDTRKRKSP